MLVGMDDELRLNLERYARLIDVTDAELEGFIASVARAGSALGMNEQELVMLTVRALASELASRDQRSAGARAEPTA